MAALISTPVPEWHALFGRVGAGWQHHLMSEESTTPGTPPPEVLAGALVLRALRVDDWPVEHQLSRDPDVV